MRLLNRPGLRFRIGLPAVLGLGVILAAFAFLGLRAVEERSAQVQYERLAMARTIAGELDRSLAHSLQTLERLATREGVDLRDSDLDPERHALADAYLLAQLPTYRMLLLDREGRVLLMDPDAPDLIDLDLSNQAFVQASLRSGRPGVSNAVPSTVFGRPVVALSVPVRDAQGNVAGVLMQAVDLREPTLTGLLRPARMGETGYAEILDGDGTVIASTHPQHLLRPWEHISVAPTLLTAKQPQGGVYPPVEGPEGADLLAFVPLSAADWGVAVEQKADEALAPIRRLRRQFFAVGLVSLLVALVLVWVIIQQVVRPVQELTSAAQHIAGGELDKAITGIPRRQDEIGELARSFEQMRVSLAAQRAIMKLRTRELSVLRETALASAEAGAVDDLVAQVTEALAADLYPENVGFLFLDREQKYLHFHPSYYGVEPQVRDLTVPLGQGVTGTVARTGKPLVVSDVRARPGYIQVSPAVRSELCVPVRAGGQVVGVINVESARQDAYAQEDLHLLSAVAGQVGIALERLRLFEEAQRRTTELEALREVTLDITARLDLSSLLEGIVRRAAELLGASGGSLYLYDPERRELELWVGHNLGADYTGSRLKLGEGLSGRVVASGQPLTVDDYRTWEGQAPAYENAAFRAIIGVPLRWQERILGVINITDLEERPPFDEHDVRLLEALARQASVAIENAQLFEAERIARQRAETLQEVAVALGSTLELEALLDRVLEELQKVVPYASATVQSLHDGQLEIIACRGFSDSKQVMGLAFPLTGDNPNRTVIAEKQPLLVPDAYAAYTAFQEEPHSHIRSWLGVPLLSKGRAIGMITLDRTEVNAFSQKEADIALAFANHAAIALENARLYQATRHQAITDGLTGLYNARYFYQALERELERSQRYGHPCSLIMLDLDDFKKYNDRYGHQAGDDLLRELAGLMCGVIRQADTPARYGGEEFAVILPETDNAQAQALAERLREAIRDHEFVVRNTQRIGRITVSQGVATYPDDAQGVDRLVEAADMALLCAKEKKDWVCVSATIQAEESTHSHGAPCSTEY